MDDIKKAFDLVYEKHRNQKRKLQNIPYIVHILDVTSILMKNNCSERVIVSGILHDIIEDTDVTIDEIRNQFGTEVSEIVSKLSEDKSKTWEERKQKNMDTLMHGSEEMMLVRCADILSNAKDLIFYIDVYGEDMWSLFKRGKDKQEWYYRGLLDSLVVIKNYQMYKEYNELVNKIF